jgi:transcriptional regulator with XRE-family HTH domain
MAARKRATKRGRPRLEKSEPSEAPSLGGWLAQFVEHAVAVGLRRVVDLGSVGLAARLPEALRARRETGGYVRELRELAGLTRGELADAIELSDRSLLEAVEAGTATLSFEMILRLAAILARHDPVPFVARLLRSHNPLLWELFRDWGVDRIPLQFERERELVNVLRGSDEARELSDADFARVLDFTRGAFEMALHFAARTGAVGARRPRTAQPAERPQRRARNPSGSRR